MDHSNDFSAEDSQSKIAFRADANQTIGAGHLMRCLALAKAARDLNVESEFLLGETDENWSALVRDSGFQVRWIDPLVDAEETASFANSHQADWIVVDGYDFDGDYFTKLKEGSHFMVLAIDDCFDRGVLPVDVVLNGNPYANESHYPDYHEEVLLFTGSEYSPLSPEFAASRKRAATQTNDSPKILITFGGTQSDAVVIEALDALVDAGVKGNVLVMGKFTATDEKIAGYIPNLSIEKRAFSDHIVEIMIDSDFAICGGGSTSLQLACLGVPCIALPIAENQTMLIKYLEGKGAIATPMGSRLSLADTVTQLMDPTRMREMSVAGSSLIDGLGSERIIRRLFQL
tara:strand:+ start:7623 stop:8657 length:1035 start_codon:yes stop_codon:yes gene_type:complete